MGVVTEHTMVIDGITYTTKTFSATEGIKLRWRLARALDKNEAAQAIMLALGPEDVAEGGSEDEPTVTADDTEGPPLLTAISAILYTALLANPILLSNMLLSAVNNLQPDEAASLFRDMLVHTTADKVRIGTSEIPQSVYRHFDTHFAGRDLHLLKVWWWVVRLGFADP